MKVKKIELDGYEDVYNMSVRDVHNFAVNGGLIMHNCDSMRYAVYSNNGGMISVSKREKITTRYRDKQY